MHVGVRVCSRMEDRLQMMKTERRPTSSSLHVSSTVSQEPVSMLASFHTGLVLPLLIRGSINHEVVLMLEGFHAADRLLLLLIHLLPPGTDTTPPSNHWFVKLLYLT